jgi:hypothetical protein
MRLSSSRPEADGFYDLLLAPEQRRAGLALLLVTWGRIPGPAGRRN